MDVRPGLFVADEVGLGLEPHPWVARRWWVVRNGKRQLGLAGEVLDIEVETQDGFDLISAEARWPWAIGRPVGGLGAAWWRGTCRMQTVTGGLSGTFASLGSNADPTLFHLVPGYGRDYLEVTVTAASEPSTGGRCCWAWPLSTYGARAGGR